MKELVPIIGVGIGAIFGVNAIGAADPGANCEARDDAGNHRREAD